MQSEVLDCSCSSCKVACQKMVILYCFVETHQFNQPETEENQPRIRQLPEVTNGSRVNCSLSMVFNHCSCTWPHVSHNLVRCQMIYLKTWRANARPFCLQQFWLAEAVTITRSFRLNQHMPSLVYCELVFLRSPKPTFRLTT